MSRLGTIIISLTAMALAGAALADPITTESGQRITTESGHRLVTTDGHQLVTAGRRPLVTPGYRHHRHRRVLVCKRGMSRPGHCRT